MVALSNGTIDDRNLIEAQDPKPNQLFLSVAFVTAFWLAAASRWIVSDTIVPWDSKNQFYAFFRFLSAALRAGDWPLLKSLSLRGSSERFRPAIAGLLTSLLCLGRASGGADYAGIRSCRPCASSCRRHRDRDHRLAGALAGAGLRNGRGIVHVRRRGIRPPATHRDHSQLQPVSGGAAAPATGT